MPDCPDRSQWERLSIVAEKRSTFAKDLYFRESWADLSRVFGGDPLKILETIALLNVKPDAVVARRMPRVLNLVRDRGFVPIAAAVLRLTRHSMRALWQYDWHVYPVDRLAFSTVWYTAADILLYVFRDEEGGVSLPASVRLAQMKGAAVAEKRAETDLRSLLAPPNRVLNFIHVADEPADIVRELGILFDTDERRSFLREILSNFSADRTEHVLEVIGALEARYPEHDLDLMNSLRRIGANPSVGPAAADVLDAIVGQRKHIEWDELCSLVHPETSGVNRWDFITIASHVIQPERDVSPDVFARADVPYKWVRK